MVEKNQVTAGAIMAGIVIAGVVLGMWGFDYAR